RTLYVGTPQLTAKVQILDDLGDVPAGFFKADPNAGDPTPLTTKLIDEHTLRKNLLPMELVIWPKIQNGPFAGNVTTWIVIDRGGRVREIDGPVSENAAVDELLRTQSGS